MKSYLHTASLIIDDIEDESETRRGEKAAHIVYGVPRALNAGNYVYFLALEKLLLLQSTTCVEVFTAEMLNLHRGQGRDIYWRTVCHIASEDEYCGMVIDKTGGLFRLAIRIMQLLSPDIEKKLSKFNVDTDDDSTINSRKAASSSFLMESEQSDFTVLANNLACYFQIRDDLINLASPKFHVKKGFCEDITEGKFSFIALHSLRTLGKSNRGEKKQKLLVILNSKTMDRALIKEALNLMNETGSFEYTVSYLRNLESAIYKSIQDLGGNETLVKLVKTISQEVDDCHDVKARVIDVA